MQAGRFWPAAAAFGIGLGLPAAAQEPPEKTPASGPATRPSEEVFPFDAHGTLDLRYRYRSVPGEFRDQDLFGSLGATATLPGVGRRGLNLNVSGSFAWDVDEFPDGGSPFTGLPDTFGNRFHAYLYEAYGELDPGGPLQNLRLGRQVLWREEGIRFDGALAQTARAGAIDFTAYAGVPVHFYESSREGDFVGGVGVGCVPDPRFRIGLDEIYVRDRRDLPGVPALEGDLLSVLSIDARFDPRWTARGSFSLLDAKERRQTIEVGYVDPESGLRANARVLRQNEFSDIPVTEFSPFVATLGAFAPYVQWQVDAGAPVVRPLDVAVGITGRRLIEGADEGLFNHEFDHGYLLFTLAPFPLPETSVGLRADGWNGGGRDLATFGASASARFGEKKEWRAEVGSDYALYRVDLLSGQEHFRDREWFGRVRCRLRKDLDLGIGYRYERDDLDRYLVADAVLGIRF